MIQAVAIYPAVFTAAHYTGDLATCVESPDDELRFFDAYEYLLDVQRQIDSVNRRINQNPVLGNRQIGVKAILSAELHAQLITKTV